MPAVEFTVPSDFSGQRLDRFLVSMLEGRSRSFVQKLIEDGRISIAGREARANLSMREGDRVFMWQGREELYRTPASHDRPYVTEEAAEWLIEERKIKALGTDSSGFEVRGERATLYPLHNLFFRPGKEVPMIECMRGLGDLPAARFFFIGAPLPVKDLDASPIRAVALVPTNPALAALLGL